MAFKLAAASLTVFLVISCTAGARVLLDASSAPAPAPAEEVYAPATAPVASAAPIASAAPVAAPAVSESIAEAPAAPVQTPPPSGCALTYVQSNGSYSMFNNILNAVPSSSNFSNVLGDQTMGITLFLPDNTAVNATLTKYGLDLDGLLKQQDLCQDIISYHILPSPIEMAAFKEGYSFNTELKGGSDLRDALRVKHSGSTIKIAGGKTTAAVQGTTHKVCMDSIFHISMLLLPKNSVTTSSNGNTSS